MDKDKEKITLKKVFYASLPQIIVLACAIIIFFAFFNLKGIVSQVEKILSILMPIIIGLVFAYLANPLVKRFEGYFRDSWTTMRKKEVKSKTAFRLPAILVTFFLVGWIIYLLVSLVVPQLYSNITGIIYAVPGQTTKYYNILMGMMSGNSWLSDIVNNAYKSIMEFLNGWLKNELFSQISIVINGLFSVVGAVSNLLIGCITAIYVLLSKETFARQSDLVLTAFFSDTTHGKIKEIIREVDRIFGGFISGKLLDSLIIGILCFIGASLLRLPYVVLVSMIVGVTNIIPFFGPYIGAIPCSILILLDSPTKGLIFIVFILILQQFDGNILGPKILGDSIGLSPFWVIFAIVLGGGLFGIVGMIIGVPSFAVIYYLVKRYIYYCLNKRKTGEMTDER